MSTPSRRAATSSFDETASPEVQQPPSERRPSRSAGPPSSSRAPSPLPQAPLQLISAPSSNVSLRLQSSLKSFTSVFRRILLRNAWSLLNPPATVASRMSHIRSVASSYSRERAASAAAPPSSFQSDGAPSSPEERSEDGDSIDANIQALIHEHSSESKRRRSSTSSTRTPAPSASSPPRFSSTSSNAPRSLQRRSSSDVSSDYSRTAANADDELVPAMEEANSAVDSRTPGAAVAKAPGATKLVSAAHEAWGEVDGGGLQSSLQPRERARDKMQLSLLPPPSSERREAGDYSTSGLIASSIPSAGARGNASAPHRRPPAHYDTRPATLDDLDPNAPSTRERPYAFAGYTSSYARGSLLPASRGGERDDPTATTPRLLARSAASHASTRLSSSALRFSRLRPGASDEDDIAEAAASSARHTSLQQQSEIASVTQLHALERGALVTDLQSLWRQLAFLEQQLRESRKELELSGKRNRQAALKAAETTERQEIEIKQLRRQVAADANSISTLSRDLALQNNETRRFHHLANSKMLDSAKGRRETDEDSTKRVTELNRQVLDAERRGDALAVDLVETKRAFTIREGSLMSQLEETGRKLDQERLDRRKESESRHSSEVRLADALERYENIAKEVNRLQEVERVLTLNGVHVAGDLARAKEESRAAETGSTKALDEWKERCGKAEEGLSKAQKLLADREMNLDRLRERMHTQVAEAEGEVRVAREESAALKERCVALEEQNEGLVDRYNEIEGILRREGLRFDTSMKRLVEEMRSKDSLQRDFLSERHLLNKQWEKREREVITALKREARKAELKQEEVDAAAERESVLKRELAEARASQLASTQLTGNYMFEGAATTPAASRRFAGGGGGKAEAEREQNLRAENVALRKENERIMMELLTLQGEKTATNVVESAAAATGGSSATSQDSEKLYAEFKQGGTGRMASEVRKMVGASGELLKKIDEYEQLKRAAERAGVGKIPGAMNWDADEGADDGKSERFYSPSPYLYR